MPFPSRSGVDIQIDGNHVTVKGPKGQLERDLAPELRIVREDGELRVERPSDEKRHRELHGLTRTLLDNMVIGVTTGFRKGLEITGVGYRAQLVGTSSSSTWATATRSRSIRRPASSFEVENPTRLAVVGIDKELVGHVAARVRSTRKPEPYKGKGVRYAGEQIRRKAGKAGKIGGKK